MFRDKCTSCAIVFLFLLATASINAQSTAPLLPTETPPASPVSASSQESKNPFSRWIELQTAAIGSVFVYGTDPDGARITKQTQMQAAFQGKFKFDAQGKFSIGASVYTNNNFMGQWGGASGKASDAAKMHLRHLYFSARPVQGVEFQFGGIDVLNGVGTEITGLTSDGFVMGQRMIIERPKNLFFDQIAVTHGYLDGFSTPDVNKRWNQLKQSNYHQFLVSKNLGTRATVSAHYTFLNGVESLSEAINISVPESKILDTVQFENYQRLDVAPAYGFAIQGEKAISKRLSLGGGFAQVDPNAGELNSDAFFSGRRVFVSATFALTSAFSVSTLYNHAVGNNFAVAKRNHFHLSFTYDLLKQFRKS